MIGSLLVVVFSATVGMSGPTVPAHQAEMGAP